MMNSEKMTYVRALSFVLTNCEMPEDVREKLTALQAQTEKRSSAERKPTKAQNEAMVNASVVTEVLATATAPVTVSELMGMDERLGEMSNQKVASLLRKLLADGKVVRTEEKHKAYFALA